MQQTYLDAIKKFEGFSQRGTWDFKQVSNGYGTRARYLGEVIDKAEAERRFRAEIEAADRLVRKFAPGLDSGTHAALTSLTYNAGSSWMRDGLGQAVQSGDLQSAREIFVQYTFAGGRSLPGLVARRETEVAWFGSGQAVTPTPTSTAVAAADVPARGQSSAGLPNRDVSVAAALPEVADETYRALLVRLLLERRARKPDEAA